MFQTVKNKIKFVEAPDRARFPYAHSLFIDDEVKVLIDTSCGKTDIDYFLEHNIDIIINSHFHEDHIMNNHKFSKSEIWAHELDAPAIRSEEVFADYYGFSKFNEERLGKLFYEWTGAKSSPVHREISHGQILDFGETKLQVLHTPGHTPGHCCFLMEDGILFSSDIELSSFGPWYGHLCSNLDDYIGSIKLCMEINPSMIISSHRGIIMEDIQKRLNNYLNIIYQKEEQVIGSLKKQSMNLDQLTDLIIFHGQIKESYRLFRMWEKMAVFVHLQRLIASGEVKQVDDYYYLK